MDNKVDVVSQIFKKHEQFSDVELRIAQFISDNPRLVAISSISKLAKMIGVSTSSISRFARILGLENIRELKFHLAQSFNRADLPTVDARLATSGYNLIYESLSTVLLNNVTTLSGSHITILSRFIEEADNIYIFGSDPITRLCAEDAKLRLFELGNVVITAESPQHMHACSRNFRSNDLVITLDITQHPDTLIPIVAKAKTLECRTAVITSQLSELTNLSDMVLAINAQDIEKTYKYNALRHLLTAYIDALELELLSRIETK
ncbi:MurR/RpiR family transcriptional regulator [Vibrio mediterranei]|jgi:DNA-binding MurR/RpiR family transcriptional regulator|uniref:MurR/RpiR family transcriptional regulator n=1 Tax=Vibrio barjaei TaxID=1676683 RepID=A0ABW7IPB0_9VIBR